MKVAPPARRSPLLLVSLLLVSFTFGSSAEAHYDLPLYTDSGSCEGKRIDPINVVFYPKAGSTAHAPYAANHVGKHVGWRSSSGGSQAVRTHGCTGQGRQRNLGFRLKHHTRFFENPHDPQASFGDAHIERLKGCGHAVYKTYEGRSGFDYAAGEIFNAFRGTHHEYGSYAKRPQRRRFKQCTGEMVAWNGRSLYFVGGYGQLHLPQGAY